jgi:hypothetical protein
MTIPFPLPSELIRFSSRRLATFLFVATVSVTAAVSAATGDLERIEALAKGGAPNLALRMLERDAPPLTQPEAWMAWERQRLAIYSAQRNWTAIVQRAEQLPANLPATFRRWMLTQAVQARLSASDPAGARVILRRLIWQESGSGEELAQWRRFVIRSYLMEGNLVDAQSALLRYQQDHPGRTEVWRTLHAEILLRTNRPKAAYEVLAGAQSFEARKLRLLAALRAGLIPPKEVLAQAEKLAEQLRAQPRAARAAWALVAAAAAQSRDQRVTRVRALEQALALPVGEDSLLAVTADDLWQAYDNLAEAAGNAERLVIGNDCAWFKRAQNYPCQQRHTARAYYAFLTQRAQGEAVRLAAHDRLLESLFAEGRVVVVQALYTQSARYATVEAVPEAVRYWLADKALADYNIQLAAQMIKDLVQPPAGEDRELWSLRRARVLIYAGDYKPALILLGGILDEHKRLDVDFADRYLQVVFDLQAAGLPAEAVTLLESVYRRVDNERMRREILFWQADSKAALGEHPVAAELYLRSATFAGANGEDPWGHTARFHAAESLGKAGLVDDARAVYRKLLESTEDPRQRALIERQIQQLWLTKTTPTAP